MRRPLHEQVPRLRFAPLGMTEWEKQMDFNDTPEEAAFRKEVRAWLDANATRKSDDKASFRARNDDPNLLAVTPWFMSLLFGTALLCLVIAVVAILGWTGLAAAWLLAGSALYLAGVILVTMLFNVPLNNILAAHAPDSTDAAVFWTRYLGQWTRWNHLRTLAPTGAAGCFILALQ